MAGPLAVQAQVLPQLAPSGTVSDGRIRVAGSTGNQVTFTVTNLNGGTDGQVSRTCTFSGSVTAVSCSPLTFVAADTTVTVTATFTTGAVGTGTITLTVDPTSPDGPAVSGTYQETVVSPAGTVTPDGLAFTLAPGQAGQTRAFLVSNTSRAKTTFTLSAACPGPGAPTCSVSPTSLTIDSAGSGATTGTTTLTYSTGAAATQGTVTVTAVAGGATVDQGSITVAVASASVTPATAPASPTPGPATFPFTVANNGVVTTSYTLTAGCTGAGVSNCSVLPAALPNVPVVPGGGSTNVVSVSYTAGSAGQAGTVTLQVMLGTVVLATGVLNVTVSNNPPVVSVTPDGGAPLVRPASTASTQTFVVTHAGQVPSTYNLVAVCTGPDAIGCPASLAPLTFSAAGGQNVVVNFTSGSSGSASGRVRLTATRNAAPAVSDDGFVDVRAITASAVPVVASLTAPPSATGQVAAFTVTNTGPVAATVALAAACAGTAVVAGSCTPSTTQLTNLAPGTPTPVNITYNTTAAGTGTVSLQVRFAAVLIATGTSTITIGNLQPPQVVAATVNPDSVWSRGQCLTVSIASASAAECGDLRIVHALPSVRTMATVRTPTLVYNSAHSIGWTMLAANVTIPAAAAVPTTVTADLIIGTTTWASGSWPGGQWTPGAVRRITLGFAAQQTIPLVTGIYDYQLVVTNVYPGGTRPTTVAGRIAVVNRATSEFGAGWWLAGLEKWAPTTAQWVGGDGSMRQYRLRPGSAAPTRVWGAPSMTFPDSIREVGTEFIRQLPDSVWVYFNASGQHTKTRNRQGHLTQFAYTAGLLGTITLPPTGSPLSYTFNYTSGRLNSVVAPGVPSSRTTTVTIAPATNRLTQFLEPDTRTVGFGYGSDNKIASRTDRRATVTGFKYDIANQVARDSIAMGTGYIKRVLSHASSSGWSGAAAPLSQVFTKLDGPRFNGATPVNTTTFYLNRFQAPDSIIDGAGQRTRLGRGNAAFPGLVDTLVTVLGHRVTATYDSRGRILSSSEPDASGALTATTSFQWDPKWDQITKITNPESDVTDFGIELSTGNRLWQQDGRGLGTRTNFLYTTSNQLRAITAPTNADQLLAYDTKGNLGQLTTPLGFQTTYTNNGIGLTTQILTPTGPTGTGTPFAVTTITYTKRNEDSIRTTTGSAKTQTLTKTFDGEGNVKTAKREFSPLAGGIVTTGLVTTWTYDNANRVTAQQEPDGSSEGRVLDDAGNVMTATTRRGKVIPMTYDALNRMLTRNLPQESYALSPGQITPAGPVNAIAYADLVPADNQAFTYKADGQLASASNHDAVVTREYFGNGLLQFETLGIRASNASAIHNYTTSYSYDKNGRRKTVTAPSTFAGTPITHTYDNSWGGPLSFTDIAGNFFAFGFNPRSELTTIAYAGNMSRKMGYDPDGRMTADTVVNGQGTAFPFYPRAKIRQFTVTSRDGAGLIRASNDLERADQVNASYDGLGHLITANLRQNLVAIPTGSPAYYATNDSMTVDAMGNVSFWIKKDSLGGNPGTLSRTTGADIYSSFGRIAQHGDAVAGPTSYSYDNAGNQTFESTVNGIDVTRERASYYGPDERLHGTDTRTSRHRTAETYRYDALGRRVWVRSNTQCDGLDHITCITPHVRRIIWDGNQELAEIRVPYDTANAAVEELDVNYPLPEYTFIFGSYGDPNPFYGHVVYSPGVEIDQPLSVTRYRYVDQPGGAGTPKDAGWGTFTWQIYWNYQGVAAYGTLTTGAAFKPRVLAQGQQTCPTLGNITTDRCVLFQWPQLRAAYDPNRGNQPSVAWHGSLLDSKRDGSGLLYRRNRVYDPQTGRFTQEDPIGLAGGLNLYGFAGGDPVNFSDPFGLCPPDDFNIFNCGPGVIAGFITAAGAIIGGTAGGFGGAGACLATVAGTVPCAFGGAIAGAATGARAGALVGTAVEAGIQFGKSHFADAGKSRGGNTGPNKQVARIVRENNLSEAGQRALHDEITGENLTLDEIRAIAERLANQAKYVNPPPNP